jgi:molecular chaperone GrpE
MSSNQTNNTNAAPPTTGATVPPAGAPAPDLTAPAAAEPAEPLAIPQTLTAEQIEDLTARAAKAEEHWDRYVRAVAELDNYRKRVARERTELIQQANERLIRELLPVLDNFEAALTTAGNAAQFEAFKAGVAMILNQLRQVLAAAGVQEIDATGQPFDPAQHEAVAHQETRAVPEGHVLQQTRKGYRLNGRLLRPASVVVAKAPAA